MLKQTTQSTIVVSLAEAKAHMHVDQADDDDEIEAYIRAAQSAIEERTRRSFAGAVFVETTATCCTVLGRIPIDTVDTVKVNTSPRSRSPGPLVVPAISTCATVSATLFYSSGLRGTRCARR